MKVYRYKEQDFVQQTSLWEALNLSWQEHMVLSFVGGGGKTSAMYRLAHELKDMGKKVIVTTSTHILLPDDYPVAAADRADTAGRYIMDCMPLNSEVGWILVTGVPVEDRAGVKKLKGMEEEQISELAQWADILLVEADGAKHLPIKVPREGEPVLIKESQTGSDAVIGCMGLDCIGENFESKCFRWELAEEILEEAKQWQRGSNQIITPACASAILSSEKGTRKSVGSREYRILLNKIDVESGLSKAYEIVDHLEMELKGKCVAASLLSGLL